ncbi:GNAT family N-acetyltransferase [Mucilaginibacter boryungensis]|uniref:GNAT family N-acetyltransferase n=1 Tax=Mucilaginibacter boryungensis TaxID=768480 RepID=A0ABR9XH33_9SPHI|nr:GNAT family N-acetyltransferase [Mucilaginibacter boryungensis]MBE9666313.1 GNAT family N-acetyltransferase [Mucilaginibacter boryungensis]
MPVTLATINDVPELTKLVNKAYRGDSSKKGWTTEAHLLDGNRIDEETMAGYFTVPGIYILKYTNESDGSIDGCVYLEEKDNKLYLGMLSVDPDLQAGGIGRMLLLEAEQFALSLNLHIIGITVISTRTELISWYQRRGYRPTGEMLPFHVAEKFGIPREKIELIVMEKPLKNE